MTTYSSETHSVRNASEGEMEHARNARREDTTSADNASTGMAANKLTPKTV